MRLEEKLQVLLKHWIEHSEAHEAELAQWARRGEAEGLTEAAGEISAAVAAHQQVARCLCQALHHLNDDPGEGPRVPE